MADTLPRRTLLKAMPGFALAGAATPAMAIPSDALATPPLTIAMRLRVPLPRAALGGERREVEPAGLRRVPKHLVHDGAVGVEQRGHV